MKIFSPHRRKMEAKRRYGGKEFQNKIKKAQGYKRVFDPRTRGFFGALMHKFRLDSRLVQFLSVVVIVGAGYYLTISDYFLVTDIKASGSAQVSSESAVQAVKDGTADRFWLIPKNHLFFMSKSRVEEILIDKLPLAKGVEKYKRSWPNKIEFEVLERQAGFAFNVNGRNYLVDNEGVVVKELQDTQGLLPVINQVNEEIKAGEALKNTKLVGFILSGIANWPSKVNSQIKEVRVPGKAAAQAQFVSSEGWGVFLDINRPVEQQLSNLQLILARQIPAQNRLQLVYIDLRFDKWAYYCYKNSPCEAKPQEDPVAEEAEKIEVQ